MAVSSASTSTPAARFGMVALTGLFFAWGFITCLNDILVPHLRAAFTLSYAQGALVQSAFFIAYFVSSLPSAAVVSRFGYKRGLSIGLVLMAVGALGFVPAALMPSYPCFLAALFVLASGITLLQVAANPYVTLLGDPATAASRLNLTQAFNALGTTVAPIIGGVLILGGSGVGSVTMPYLGLAAILAALAALFFFLRLEEPREAPARVTFTAVSATLKEPTLALGVLAIFLYVGAEVAIGSFLVDYIKANLTHGDAVSASHYVAFYWGGAMIGRFIGSLVMRVVPAPLMLLGAGIGAALLVGLSFVLTGEAAVYALLAVGLCNSIMFPTIFSLSIRKLGPLTGVGSSLLAMAICGGAVIPLLVGSLADSVGLKAGLALPVLCYLYIMFFGAFNRSLRSPRA